MSEPLTAAALTVREAAKLLRVGSSKILKWLRSGELKGINTAASLCGRPRYIILPDAITEFQKRRSAAVPPKPPRRRRRTEEIDFFP